MTTHLFSHPLPSFHQAKQWFLIGATTIALTLTPAIVKAQSASAPAPLMDALEQLNLTSNQEAQLAEIRRNTQAQVAQILTSEQRSQFRTSREQGNTVRTAIAAMNLSDDQKTQLRQIFQNSRQAVSQILTPEQQQQARTWWQNHRNQESQVPHQTTP